VLGRGVEQMVLREILHHARRQNVTKLIGIFVPTERNALVINHYEKLGFTLVARAPSGATSWELPADADVQSAPMTVDRSAFELAAV